MKVKTAKRLDQVQEYYFSTKLKQIAQMRAEGINVINLGIGSPDIAPSSATIDALVNAAQKKENHAYQSYVGIPSLRKAFATWYEQFFGVTLNAENEILPLLGSKEGIMHISMTFLETGDEVLVPNPGYPTYRSASLLAGATVIEYNLNEENAWLPDLEELQKQDLSKVKLMWVNYPHMPTGAKANVNFFEKLRDFSLKNNILIVNDNPYAFILNEHPLSIFCVEGMKEIALELNSLSKSHNMAGWRVGMLAGNPELLANVLRFKSNMDSGMFLPVQLAAIQALSSSASWYSDLNLIYKKRQLKVFEILETIGCTYDTDQTGMFVWAKIPSKYQDSYQLSDIILNGSGVFITPGGIFGSQGNRYIRIALCADEQIFQEALSLIQKINLNTNL
ncbi:MAG: aminotransferase class I/II-fold pyridoxal phosphate-dependent enzyme [Pseudarcicella sp.]|nr:aminotransferase class I/II-fold pyridoxal phosphate-dependent enzyme [Pseudarcicella sp.]MBP6410815.1 aminotransferase class I/II-fold pyridoxal phosphate-dependent enzyme [Pseudarcicella sp.]